MNIPKCRGTAFRALSSCRERGQAMIEFAFVMPLVVLLLMGVFDLGRAVYAYNTLQSVARETARYGTFKPSSIMDSCTFPFLTEYCQNGVANTAALDPTLIVITSRCLLKDRVTQVTPTQQCVKPYILEVSVRYTFQPVTLLFSPLPLTGKTEMMIELAPQD